MKPHQSSLDFSIIFGACNNDALPSSTIQAHTRAEKSFAIAVWAQEMALAGLMRAEQLSGVENPSRKTVESSLLTLYASAGCAEPHAALNTAKATISSRLAHSVTATPGIPSR